MAKKNPNAVALVRLGGLEKAKALTDEERSAIAKKAAAARNARLYSAERSRIAKLAVKARGHWYVRYFEDRMVDGQLRHDRVAKQIVTTRGKRPPREIEDEARDIPLAKITNANPERVLRMTEFVDGVYFPHIRDHKRPSTQKGYKDIWENHLKVRCAGVWLKDVRTFHVQAWLDAIAAPGTLGRNSLKHIKTFLSAVFKVAKQAREPQETYAYDLTEIQQMLSVMPEPAATIFAVAAFTGLRRGEVQGLRWENYQDDEIRVSRAIWEGHVSDPKTGRSKGAVPVIKQVADRLDFHRLRHGEAIHDFKLDDCFPK
jgi:hypothetical protein